MTARPANATISFWTALLRAHRATFEVVEAALREANLPPLAWYDVLLELDRRKGGGVRLNELEKALLLPQYGTSRLVRKLEEHGAVARMACADDGRGFVITITREGRRLRQRMWPVYARAIERAVGRHMTGEEASFAGEILRRLYSPTERAAT